MLSPHNDMGSTLSSPCVSPDHFTQTGFPKGSVRVVVSRGAAVKKLLKTKC